jgi:uncharacterized protein with HEPN domain
MELTDQEKIRFEEYLLKREMILHSYNLYKTTWSVTSKKLSKLKKEYKDILDKKNR